MSKVSDMFATWLQGFAIGTLIAFLVVVFSSPPIPRLIGHDCQRSGGDLWAMEESDFPPCRMIERNK